jgi:hypothetical protein
VLSVLLPSDRLRIIRTYHSRPFASIRGSISQLPLSATARIHHENLFYRITMEAGTRNSEAPKLVHPTKAYLGAVASGQWLVEFFGCRIFIFPRFLGSDVPYGMAVGGVFC